MLNPGVGEQDISQAPARISRLMQRAKPWRQAIENSEAENDEEFINCMEETPWASRFLGTSMEGEARI